MLTQRSASFTGHNSLSLTADLYGDESDPAVVFLHGGGQTRHAWGNAAVELANSRRFAVSLDLRGHGESDWALDGDYDIGAFAADVLAIVKTLQTRPVLVGASLGGLTALIAIGESSEPVADALVLVDVAPRVEREGADRIRAFMRSGAAGFASIEDAADAISAYIPNRPRPKDLSGLNKNLRLREDGRYYWHWDPRFLDGSEGIDGQSGHIDHARLAAAARRVTVPTLLVRGGASDVLSDESVRDLLELVPHAEVADVAGAGHMVAGDRNDAFTSSVIDFIDRTVPR